MISAKNVKADNLRNGTTEKTIRTIFLKKP